MKYFSCFFTGLTGYRTDSCHAQVSNSQLLLDDPAACQPSESEYNMRHFRLAKSRIIKQLQDMSAELMYQSRDDLPPERRVSLGQQFLAYDRELLHLAYSATTHLTISNVSNFGPGLLSHSTTWN